VCVDVRPDNERNNVEEWHPRFLWQELLRKRQRKRRGNPADLHDWPETGSDGRADLVEGACTSDDGHGGQVDGVLDRRDDQVGNKDLHDLRPQARPASKQALKDADEDVAQWRTDERAVHSHLGHARCEVVTILVAVFRNPRREYLLKS